MPCYALCSPGLGARQLPSLCPQSGWVSHRMCAEKRQACLLKLRASGRAHSQPRVEGLKRPAFCPNLTELAESRDLKEIPPELCALVSSPSLHCPYPGQHIPRAPDASRISSTAGPPQHSTCVPSSPTLAIVFPETATKSPSPNLKMLVHALTRLWAGMGRKLYLFELFYPTDPTTTSITSPTVRGYETQRLQAPGPVTS